MAYNPFFDELYDTRTMAGRNAGDSSDDEPVQVTQEALYDQRTMGGIDDDEDELPSAPPRAPPAAARAPPPASQPPPRPTPAVQAPVQAPAHQAPRQAAAASTRAPPRSSVDFATRGMQDMHMAPPPAPPRASLAQAQAPVAWWETVASKHGFTTSPWFHGAIERDVAETRLTAFPLNSFLIRASLKLREGKHAFVLSVKNPGKCMHVQIYQEDDGDFSVGEEGQAKHRFGTVQEIIEFYRHHDYAMGHRLATICPALSPPMREGRAATVAARPAPAPAHSPAHSPPAATAAWQELMFGEEAAVYVDAEKEDAESARRRAMGAVQQQALPSDPRTWNNSEVLRFLVENGLQCFKQVFYSNAIEGSRFVELNGSQFKRGGFSETECAELQRIVSIAKRMVPYP